MSTYEIGILFNSALNVLEAAQDVVVVCVMTPWVEFKKLSSSDLIKRMSAYWQMNSYWTIDGKVARGGGIRYVTLGIAPENVWLAC